MAVWQTKTLSDRLLLCPGPFCGTRAEQMTGSRRRKGNEKTMLKKKKGDAKPASRKECLDTAREEIFGGLSGQIDMTLLANLVQPHGQPRPERSVGSARTVGA